MNIYQVYGHPETLSAMNLTLIYSLWPQD